MRTALYSAIYGGYDDPKPLPAGLDVPAFMFTDSRDTARAALELGWHPYVVPHGIATLKGDPTRVAPMLAHKYWKTHPQALIDLPGAITGYHPEIGLGQVAELEAVLWVDGSITIVEPDYVARCLQALGSDDVAFTPHPWRDCAIAEGEYSATLARYQQTPVGRQTQFYSRFHPKRWGLFASGAIAWRVNPLTRAFGHAWWEEILNWSHQDQVSLPVLLRLTDECQFGPMEGMDLAWNSNLPWEKWWTLAHHRVAP